jgi:hypothetical protein
MAQALDPRIAMIARRYAQRLSDAELEARLADMVIVLSAPRSGSTLLFDLLSRADNVLTIGGETHSVYRQFPHLAAENEAFDSGMLGEQHADEATVRGFRCLFLALLRNRHGQLLHDLPGRSPAGQVIVEKTPRNALNLPFLKRVFPAARFLFLYRHPAEVIASLIEGWETGARTGQFVTHRHLPGWDRAEWCFALPRGWRELRGKSLAEIAAFQWSACNRQIREDAGALPQRRLLDVAYDELIDSPGETLRRIGETFGIKAGAAWTPDNLPVSASTISAPRRDKWRAREAEIAGPLAQVMPLFDDLLSWSTARR